MCAHEPDCVSKDCSGHGQCVMGQCLCDSHWTGDSCDVLKCQQHNCSSNGQCSAEGETYMRVCLVYGEEPFNNIFRKEQLVFTGRKNVLNLLTQFFYEKNLSIRKSNQTCKIVITDGHFALCTALNHETPVYVRWFCHKWHIVLCNFIQTNKPFAWSGHMVQNKLLWDAITQWDFQNKGTCTSPARLSFVWNVPLCYLRPCIIYSMPCDGMVQRCINHAELGVGCDKLIHKGLIMKNSKIVDIAWHTNSLKCSWPLFVKNSATGNTLSTSQKIKTTSFNFLQVWVQVNIDITVLWLCFMLLEASFLGQLLPVVPN